jgi:hypothetical protein
MYVCGRRSRIPSFGGLRSAKKRGAQPNIGYLRSAVEAGGKLSLSGRAFSDRKAEDRGRGGPHQFIGEELVLSSNSGAVNLLITWRLLAARTGLRPRGQKVFRGDALV